MEKSNQNSISNKLKKLIRGGAYFIVICVLFSFAVLSLVFEILWSKSVTATMVTLIEHCSFFKKYCACLSLNFLKNVPKILSASVILEIVKILGFGSVLFGVVQALMDKKTFGVSYATIVKNQFHYYQEIFVIHLVATVMCIGFSAAGASEGALVTLLIMILGFLYLWFIIDDLVFHTTNRERFAIDELKKDLSNSNFSSDDILNVLQNIAREASKDSNIDKYNITKCFAESFYVYCDKKKICNSIIYSGNSIRDVASVWEIALQKKSELQQFHYAARVIVECCKIPNANKTSLLVLTSGFELFLFSQLNKSMGNMQNAKYNDFFVKLSNQVYSVNNALSEHFELETINASLVNSNIQLVQRYIKTFYTILVFTNVENGNLRISSELFETVETDYDLGNSNTALIETVCATMPLTTQKEYEKAKDIVKNVLDKLGLHKKEVL